MSGPIKSFYKQLVKELEIISDQAFQHQAKDMLKKETSMIQYRRMQYFNSGKVLTPEEDAKLVKEVKKQMKVHQPEVDTSYIEHLNADSLHKVDEHHLINISTFLTSQRVYAELLERYNPGISMKQEDKVRKTARRVGLEVPK